MTIQLTSRLIVHQDKLVNPLMTDLDRIKPLQPSRDLLRAPIQTKLRFDQIPCFWQNVKMAVIVTTKRLPFGGCFFVIKRQYTDARETWNYYSFSRAASVRFTSGAAHIT